MTLDESADERRFVEIDSVLWRLNLTIAVVVAGASVLFVSRFGVGFVFFASLPLTWWTGRCGLRVHRLIGLRRWNIGLIITLIASITGGTATSGGFASPVVFFAGLIGLFAQSTFPNSVFSRVGGLVTIAMIAGIDLIRDQTIEVFDLIAAAVIAGYLPLLARELVTVEQFHRRTAVLDVLTGCLNRRSFGHHSAEIDAQARFTGASVAVISFDIDHFKVVNDDRGHAAGDQVLANLADVARRNLRQFELMFRVDGEEFVVLLPDGTPADSVSVAEHLRREIEATSVDGIRITASFGVAVGSDGVENVLARADERLYTAKNSGRNCVVGPDGTPASASAVPPAATSI